MVTTMRAAEIPMADIRKIIKWMSIDLGFHNENLLNIYQNIVRIRFFGIWILVDFRWKKKFFFHATKNLSKCKKIL